MPTPDVTVLPDALFFATDRPGPVPLYFQIAQCIEHAIRDGQLPTGGRLENEIDLAGRLGISRPTMRRALQELVGMGLLVRRRGIGTQVVPGQISRSIAPTSLYEDLERASRHPMQQVLTHEHVAAGGDVAEHLGLAPETGVLHLRRVRFADDVPIAVLENFLPGPYDELTRDQLERHGMYQLLKARGAAVAAARQRIGARRATPEEACLLDMPRSASVLTMTRTAFDNSGRTVEYGTHVYRPGLYSFEITQVGR